MNADLYEHCTSVVIQPNGKVFISISDSAKIPYMAKKKKKIKIKREEKFNGNQNNKLNEGHS